MPATEIHMDGFGRKYGILGLPQSYDSDHIDAAWNSIQTLFTCNTLVLCHQVHGCEIAEVPARLASGIHHIAAADAIILKREHENPGVALAVRTADCLGVVVSSATAVAVIHAGWRGMKLRLLEKVLAYMRKKHSTELSAWIAPAAHDCCYQVGPEIVAEDVPRSSFRSDPTETGRFKLSMRGWAEWVLRQSGVEAIRVDDRCTVCSDELHSFRRDRSSGRNMCFATTKTP